jgi:hypothetical protein
MLAFRFVDPTGVLKAMIDKRKRGEISNVEP